MEMEEGWRGGDAVLDEGEGAGASSFGVQEGEDEGGGAAGGECGGGNGEASGPAAAAPAGGSVVVQAWAFADADAGDDWWSEDAGSSDEDEGEGAIHRGEAEDDGDGLDDGMTEPGLMLQEEGWEEPGAAMGRGGASRAAATAAGGRGGDGEGEGGEATAAAQQQQHQHDALGQGEGEEDTGQGEGGVAAQQHHGVPAAFADDELPELPPPAHLVAAEAAAAAAAAAGAAGVDEDAPLDGFRVKVWRDGSRYAGEWENNKMCGYGEMRWADGRRYVGFWHENRCNGRGVLTYKDGRRYEGEYKDDKMDGRGLYYWAEGARYEGFYCDHKKHGRGIMTWKTGGRYDGDYVDDKMTGYGVMTWADGRRYEGEWFEGRCTGRGTTTFKSGSRYMGSYMRDKMEGRGFYSFADGRRYEGQYLANQKHGRGVYMWSDGVMFSGTWKHGAPVRGVLLFPGGMCARTGTTQPELSPDAALQKLLEQARAWMEQRGGQKRQMGGGGGRENESSTLPSSSMPSAMLQGEGGDAARGEGDQHPVADDMAREKVGELDDGDVAPSGEEAHGGELAPAVAACGRAGGGSGGGCSVQGLLAKEGMLFKFTVGEDALGRNAPCASDGGRSPFVLACSEGLVDVVRWWLAAEWCRPNVADAVDGATGLHLACSNGHEDVATALLEATAKVADAVDASGRTPVACACSGGHVELAALVASYTSEEGALASLVHVCVELVQHRNVEGDDQIERIQLACVSALLAWRDLGSVWYKLSRIERVVDALILLVQRKERAGKLGDMLGRLVVGLGSREGDVRLSIISRAVAHCKAEGDGSEGGGHKGELPGCVSLLIERTSSLRLNSRDIDEVVGMCTNLCRLSVAPLSSSNNNNNNGKSSSSGGGSIQSCSDSSDHPLPASLTQCSSLCYLSLPGMMPSKGGLPGPVLALPSLLFLDVSGASATSMAGITSAAWLASLRCLDVSSNALTLLPSIGILKQLTSFNVANNKITEWPGDLARCSTLRILEASGNQNLHLPPWIQQLAEIRRIGLSNNSLSSLWHQRTAMPTTSDSSLLLPPLLETLDISSNRFAAPPSAVVDWLAAQGKASNGEARQHPHQEIESEARDSTASPPLLTLSLSLASNAITSWGTTLSTLPSLPRRLLHLDVRGNADAPPLPRCLLRVPALMMDASNSALKVVRLDVTAERGTVGDEGGRMVQMLRGCAVVVGGCGLGDMCLVIDELVGEGGGGEMGRAAPAASASVTATASAPEDVGAAGGVGSVGGNQLRAGGGGGGAAAAAGGKKRNWLTSSMARIGSGATKATAWANSTASPASSTHAPRDNGCGIVQRTTRTLSKFDQRHRVTFIAAANGGGGGGVVVRGRLLPRRACIILAWNSSEKQGKVLRDMAAAASRDARARGGMGIVCVCILGGGGGVVELAEGAAQAQLVARCLSDAGSRLASSYAVIPSRGKWFKAAPPGVDGSMGGGGGVASRMFGGKRIGNGTAGRWVLEPCARGEALDAVVSQVRLGCLEGSRGGMVDEGVARFVDSLDLWAAEGGRVVVEADDIEHLAKKCRVRDESCEAVGLGEALGTCAVGPGGGIWLKPWWLARAASFVLGLGGLWSGGAREGFWGACVDLAKGGGAEVGVGAVGALQATDPEGKGLRKGVLTKAVCEELLSGWGCGWEVCVCGLLWLGIIVPDKGGDVWLVPSLFVNKPPPSVTLEPSTLPRPTAIHDSLFMLSSSPGIVPPAAVAFSAITDVVAHFSSQRPSVVLWSSGGMVRLDGGSASLVIDVDTERRSIILRGGAGGGGDADGGSISAVMTARAKQTVDGLMSCMDMGDECAWLASRGGGAWYAEGPGEHS